MTLNFCDHIPRADLDHHPAHQRGNVRRPVHVEAKSQVKLLSRSDRIASDENSQRDPFGAARFRGSGPFDLRTIEGKSAPRRIRNGLLFGRPGNFRDTANRRMTSSHALTA